MNPEDEAPIDAPAPDEESPAQDPGDQPLDAVIIVKTTDEQGNIGADVILNGTVNVLEAATLIKLGARAWDKKIGLEG